MEDHIDKIVYIVIAVVITIVSSITKAKKKKTITKLGTPAPSTSPPVQKHNSQAPTKVTTPTPATSQIIIVPGYKFRVIDSLVTNFHQPKSTLLLLISALIGSDWKELYDFALENDYRFLSYGDSSILIPR